MTARLLVLDLRSAICVFFILDMHRYRMAIARVCVDMCGVKPAHKL